MSTAFTKSMARNIFYGGAVFSFLLFLALTFHTTRAIPQRSHAQNLTPEVARGKLVWETNNCIGCHTLLGEGAYFAPELECVPAAGAGIHQSLDQGAAHRRARAAADASVPSHRRPAR